MGIDRIVFFGTPAFAVPALEALVAAGRRPVLVVTQPARPAGRGRKLVEPPVAVRARELGLEVEAVERVRAPEFLERLATLAPDLAVVVAFGQIFPRALLELPRLGCLNVHASLLPRWRGAAPIAAAIAEGDAETGVAIQRMEEGLDTGPVYASRSTPIGAEETAGELTARLAGLGAELLVEVISRLERGDLVAIEQDAAGATHASKLAGVRDLDLTRSAVELAREVRAYTPEPGAALAIRGERVKVLGARDGGSGAGTPPGIVLGVVGESLRLAAAGDSVLELVRAQRPGGRPVSGRDLANGLRLTPGEAVG
ncbi:MAG: methionyl-tRNA formyltransferase [Acidobacteriota bacterium]